MKTAELYLFVAPPVLPLGLRSGLLKLERGGRVTSREVDAGLELISAAEVQVMPEPDEDALVGVFRLARSIRLAFFDAFYVDLGLRFDCPLASRDGLQLQAATWLGVETLDLRGPPA